MEDISNIPVPSSFLLDYFSLNFGFNFKKENNVHSGPAEETKRSTEYIYNLIGQINLLVNFILF